MKKYLIKRIAEMVRVDQGMRFKGIEMMKEREKQGKKTKKGELELENFMVYSIDAVHSYRIRRIIEQHGYPTQNMIGKEGMKNFWLLVQHQDFDLDLQEKCLENCDFEPQQKAYLTDRVRVNQGKKQVYGTQFDKPIEDEENVEQRRKEVGLEPLSEYLKKRKK